MLDKENYNPRQNYYFVDYSLWEKGHPEYVQYMKEKDPSYPKRGRGIYRWIRQPFQTEQEVQETLNYFFHSHPNRIEGLRIRSEEELNEIVVVDKETGEELYDEDTDSYKKGLKMTRREHDFGGMYQRGYELTLGLIDHNLKPINTDVKEKDNKKPILPVN